jgi:hypothetical protein
MPPVDSLPPLSLPTGDELDPLLSPLFWRWVLGQSIAFVTLLLGSIAWVRFLIGQVKHERQRSDELAILLVQHTERALTQRAKDIDDFALREDSSRRNLLDFFKGLADKPSTTEHSIAQKLPTKLSEHRGKKARKPPESDDELTPPG